MCVVIHLSNPSFIENDKLKKFDVILANPPYSIKSWDKKVLLTIHMVEIFGEHHLKVVQIMHSNNIFKKSLNVKKGRSCVLWPYGVLFRDNEKNRKKMIENDLVECVISLGKNLFYNSTMESCLLITNNKKERKR